MVERRYSRSLFFPTDVPPERFWEAMARCVEAIRAQWAPVLPGALRINVKDEGGEYTVVDLAEAEAEASTSRHPLREVDVHWYGASGPQERLAYISGEALNRRIYVDLRGPNEAEVVGLVAVLGAELEAVAGPTRVPSTPPATQDLIGVRNGGSSGGTPAPQQVRWYRREAVRDGLIVALIIAIIAALAYLMR